MIEPRMDGKAINILMWRVSALREALLDVVTCDNIVPAREMAQNALYVDDENNKTLESRINAEPDLQDSSAIRQDSDSPE